MVAGLGLRTSRPTDSTQLYNVIRFAWSILHIGGTFEVVPLRYTTSKNAFDEKMDNSRECFSPRRRPVAQRRAPPRCKSTSWSQAKLLFSLFNVKLCVFRRPPGPTLYCGQWVRASRPDPATREKPTKTKTSVPEQK